MSLSYARALRALAAAAVSTAALAAPSLAATTVFKLSDHPDGEAALPTYGFRMDTMFSGRSGAGGGVTLFSFNTYDDVLLKVTDDGGSLKINISGTVYGGEKSGSGFAYGAGAYHLEANYTMHVNAQGTGWVVAQDAPLHNTGSLTALSGGDVRVADGEVFNFHDMSAASFLFLQDNHRLAGHSEFNQGFWVGRGWVTYNPSGANSGGTQDFLFIGNLVPLPTPVGLACAGLFGAAAVRRRRA